MSRKNLCAVICIISLLLAASCKKSESPLSMAWSFKGTKYTESACTAGGGIILAQTVNRASSLLIVFNIIGDPTPGTYMVIRSSNGYYSPNVVGISFDDPIGSVYGSTGGNGANQSIIVTSVNNKLNAVGSVEVFNSNVPSDSAELRFNITQQ